MKLALITRFLIPENIAFLEEWLYWNLHIVGFDKIFLFTDERATDNFFNPDGGAIRLYRHSEVYRNKILSLSYEEHQERFINILNKFDDRVVWKRITEENFSVSWRTKKFSQASQLVSNAMYWFFDNERKNYDWLALLDPDEFLYVQGSLRMRLKLYGLRASLVYLTNKLFLDYSHSQEKYMTSIYNTFFSSIDIRRDQNAQYLFPASYTRKYFVRCSKMKRHGWYCHGGRVRGKTIWANYHVLRRNHYRMVPGSTNLGGGTHMDAPIEIDGYDDSLRRYRQDIERNVSENLFDIS